MSKTLLEFANGMIDPAEVIGAQRNGANVDVILTGQVRVTLTNDEYEKLRRWLDDQCLSMFGKIDYLVLGK